jgi:hypothetical protein
MSLVDVGIYRFTQRLSLEVCEGSGSSRGLRNLRRVKTL